MIKDFIGMDMCRKFLEMGFTRARRYAITKMARSTKMVKYCLKKKIEATSEKAKAKQYTKNLEIELHTILYT